MTQTKERTRSAPTVVAGAALLAALIGLAVVSLWLGRHALDADRFIPATEEVLGTRESREVLAADAVEAVVDEFPLLSVFEPAAVDVLAVAFDSPALDAVKSEVAEDIHNGIVTGDDSAVTVSLSSVRDVVLEPISAIAPAVVEAIPNELLDGIEVIEPGALPSLRSAASVTPWLGLVALVLAAGLAAMLIVALPDKPVAVMAVGAGIAGGGLLGLAAAPAGRALAAGWATTELADVLAAGVYDRLVTPLIAGSVALIVVGIMVAVAPQLFLRK